MSTFQIVVLGIFSTLILVGIGVFAAFGGLLSGSQVGPVVMWGTLDAGAVSGVLDELRAGGDKTFENVSYVHKDPATYNTELVNAMASGSGPDLFIISDEDLYSFADKIQLIPYSAFTQGTFLASYIDDAQVFLTTQGAYALPFTVDPLVMYWNRDLFASAGEASAPVKWNDLLALAPKITSLGINSAVQKSAVALGEWRNIPHAKEILSTLFMQAGDNIIARDSSGVATVVLGNTPEGSLTNPAESALRFYTEFGNPSKTTYSWNRSLPSAADAFVAGDLGVYFGLASEYASLSARNPNLRFGVAVVPQVGGSQRIAFGRIEGLAISRSAQNPRGALTVAEALSSKSAVALISGALSLPPVRRDVAVDTSGSAAAGVFMESSLIARSWLDPNPTGSDGVFQTMIESVISGNATPAGAVADGARTLRDLLQKQ